MTLVSIITPSFNQAAYLEETIQSVLSQDYPELEYIVVDGGSTDGSLDIIQRYAGKLAWWISEPDSGQAEAINKGLAHARGEIVAWLNSDDVYLPGAVNSAVTTLQANPESGMVFGNMLAIDESGRTINVLKYGDVNLEDLLAFSIIGQPAVFLRRSVLDQAGGLDTSFHFLLDHHLWIRVASRVELKHVPVLWAAARYHPAAKNLAHAAEFGKEAFRILEWAKGQTEIASILAGCERRAHASAHRVDARYLLDGGQPWRAVIAWGQAFCIHPLVALARLNLLASALLNLAGLRGLRSVWFRWRQRRISKFKG